jgi:hypothetical protein
MIPATTVARLLGPARIYGPVSDRLLGPARIYGPVSDRLLGPARIYGPANSFGPTRSA